ncbi:MAG: guanylate kinase [Lachnospiraceae bacterium]|uniref:guanylate kinase n=1 Tax=Candidatus Merdisoma sp. JLR.KK011 TaxID=3114299 RepID=UPI00143493FF|nr:guanylate kinase [Lachnospiraceae bacterium]MCI9623703.1 guanylate kinase [Lachnospiraceae bacterium]GFI10040.1 guanylate kinase [Lachnospiraceae bacterium]
MGKIFYIFGKSSTGKDTIYKSLMENKELGLRPVVPYTTRPMRAKETPGVEYHFTDEEELSRLQAAGKVIELRAYETVHGIWKYFTVDGKHMDLANYNYAMVGVLDSFLAIREYYGADKVIPIYIEVEDGERLQRALDRERSQEEPKYAEMCRRFLTDSADFAEEKLLGAGLVRRFFNKDLKECIQEITACLQEEMEM